MSAVSGPAESMTYDHSVKGTMMKVPSSKNATLQLWSQIPKVSAGKGKRQDEINQEGMHSS